MKLKSQKQFRINIYGGSVFVRANSMASITRINRFKQCAVVNFGNGLTTTLGFTDIHYCFDLDLAKKGITRG